jgi:RNA polymerase sigma factor (sigma-70 family)
MLDLTRERLARDLVADRLEQADLADTVRAARRGDQRAWNALVARFTPALRRTARMYRLGPHDVDDVVQLSWVALLTSIHTLREPQAVGAWLVTTARRQALRARQREVRESLTAQPASDLAVDDLSPESVVVATERLTAVRDAVTRLPDRQRALLQTLFGPAESSYAEVSQDLGMPIGSIGPTRDRGLRRLRGDERLTEVLSA